MDLSESDFGDPFSDPDARSLGTPSASESSESSITFFVVVMLYSRLQIKIEI